MFFRMPLQPGWLKGLSACMSLCLYISVSDYILISVDALRLVYFEIIMPSCRISHRIACKRKCLLDSVMRMDFIMCALPLAQISLQNMAFYRVTCGVLTLCLPSFGR